ncbi:MAG: hypothetical protein HY832_00265 [Candidatus Aenigmarchaeota archaeon]|nr:hypothetical protein [Candidatus Aenigmarchaeota archaeon]
MRIEIRKNGLNAVIITFHTKIERFESDYERSKFFRELYGWKQTVPNNGKKYLYHRPGLLDDVPHIKVADSAFIVALKDMERMLEYFKEWSDKVEYEMLEIIMRNQEQMKKLLEEEDKS